MSTRLEALARCQGIALSYRDIWSHERHAEPDVLRALLHAMRVDARDDAAVERALADHRRAQWQRVLPATSLLQDAQASIRLCLPAHHCSSVLTWQVTEEDGSTHGGEVRTADCPEQAREQVDGQEHVALEWRLQLELPSGYHDLQVTLDANGSASAHHSLLISAPATCHLPRALQAGARAWGVSVQVHALRSARNWGIGDFTDLAAVADLWGRRGAGIVGVNPLHALFPHNPAHISPYSPSSRRFVNALYIDIAAVPEFADCTPLQAWLATDAVQAQLQQVRAAPLIDHVAVAALKWPALERLFAHFSHQHIAHDTPRARAFAAYCAEQGEALRHHALFEALQQHFHRADSAVWGWPVWPEDYRAPDAPAVLRFGEQHAERVRFHQYVQWLCDEQLGAVACRMRALGIGLYKDLAVSVDRAGADAWSDQATLALQASIGAPPDEFNPSGQDWGLPPPIPGALERAGFTPFIQTLRAGMRHAGALRIDHVMALMRLYWTSGGSAARGAFVHYPFDVLLAIVRLESQRHRCAVIGEALGTVPEGLRERLSESGMLSYRVLIFERDAQGFATPGQMPRDALMAASTHDLPTLAGWWQGHDIDVRAQLAGADTQATAGAHEERRRERVHLLQALQRERLLPHGWDPSASVQTQMTHELARAVHRYLARCPSKIVLVQIEDALLQLDQVNLPGTTDSHPNWRRKLSLDIEHWSNDASIADLARTLAQERGEPQRAAVIPRATYRVQLSRDFTFADARALVPYLAELGVSHLYCSPFLRARAGSLHGYDIVDHRAIHPDIGTRAAFDALVAELQRNGMAMLIDVVPNHMGVHGSDNAWWLDVLECGPASAYAEYFDIDWRSADPSLFGRVLLPILGDQYGLVLERHELQLKFDAASGTFQVMYHDHRLPIDPSCYGDLIRAAIVRQSEPAACSELVALAAAFDSLPARDDARHRDQRRADKKRLQDRLARSAGDMPGFATALAGGLAAINNAADPAALDLLLGRQAYRLANWRVAADEINYRRFFDINDLAALRMERADVFEATHALVLSLAASGEVAGLRIDHSDGLADPAGYFRRLQQGFAARTGDTVDDRAAPRPLYVVTEKITAPHERLPTDWLVHGTTGYRFANVVNALLVDSGTKQRLDRAWRAFAGDEAEDFGELAWLCRHIVMESSLAGELNVLATALWRLAREDRRTRDFSLNALRRALAAVVASFPVYRTYIADEINAADRRTIDWAIGRARRRSLSADASVFEFIRRVLLGNALDGAPPALVEGYRAFARRLQQYTAPVAAKGIEDTALYRHNRLISLNDVGGDPDDFGLSQSAFHGASRDRALHWPHTLLATSTHDSKRSEDVRARIDVISEMPAAWRLTVRRWSRANRRHKRAVDGESAPSRNDEYLLYQTLAGSFPSGPLGNAELVAYSERIEQAMLKSVRESKVRTSWIQQHMEYEAALSSFVRAMLEPRESNLFLPDLRETAATLAWYGALNGLTLAAIKGLSPGVPDYYQGHETIALTLVDPDNRRPIDYGHRRELLQQARMLEELPGRAAVLREWLAQAPDGRAKFWVTRSVLRIRLSMEQLYRRPTYVPMELHGSRAKHLIAFAVHDDTRCVLAVAPRLYASLGLAVGEAPTGAVWGDTEVVWPRAELRADAPELIDEITGQRRGHGPRWRVADLLSEFPVAALQGRIEDAA
jgi:(1->4)-alpha-D-glucan 1-alpha-D-glucosylmutase